MASDVIKQDKLLRKITRISSSTFVGASDRKRALLQIKSLIDQLFAEENSHKSHGL